MRDVMHKGILPAFVLLSFSASALAIDTDRPEVQQFIDRMVEEQITIKMPTSTYEAVVEALRQVMG